MIIIVLLLIILAVRKAERKWGNFAINALQIHSKCDSVMAEPGQPVTWSATVENHSRRPISFVRLIERFPDQVDAVMEEAWLLKHRKEGILSWICENCMSIPARSSVTRYMTLRFPHRGAYKLGEYDLSAGDFLGLQERNRHGFPKTMVVIPEHSGQRSAIDALGGFLGDISVQRFIMEDPVLTVGFQDYSGREPLRDISWIRTAVTGALQVKRYDHTLEHHVVVLLNVEDAQDESLEECLRLTRTVCERLEQEKIPYGFRTNGNLPGPIAKILALPESLGPRHLNTILYGLGGTDKTRFFSFRYLTHQTLRKRKNNESYIVITPAKTPEAMACIRSLDRAVDGRLCVLTGQQEDESL